MQTPLSSASQIIFEALGRYAATVNTLAFPADMAEQLGVAWKAVDPADVARVTQTLAGTSIPAELHAIWTELGVFSVPADLDWGTLTLFSSDDGPLAKGLLSAIADTWGGDRPEIQRYLSPAERERVDSELLCFGVYTHDDNAHTYLCFDRTGNAAAYLYDQDDWAAFEARMRQTPRVEMRVPALITAILDATASALTEEREDYGPADVAAFIHIDRPESASAASPTGSPLGPVRRSPHHGADLHERTAADAKAVGAGDVALAPHRCGESTTR